MSNRPDILYPDSTERSVYDDQDITTGRRRRARGLRSYENTVDETDHALGHKGVGLGTFLPKTGLEQGGFKDTALNY